MNFRQFLEINVPNYLPQLFWEKSLEKSIELESILSNSWSILQSSVDFADETGEDSIKSIIQTLKYGFRKFLENKYDSWIYSLNEQMSSLSNAYKLHMQPFIIDEIIERIINIVPNMVHFQDFVREYKQFYNIKYYNYNNKFEALLDIDKDHKNIHIQSKYILTSLLNYFNLCKSVSNHVLNSKNPYDKKTKSIEILYHATPFVSEIMSSGFKTKKELGHESLGGSGQIQSSKQEGISFTSDINIAKAISMALKDVINIAQGRLHLNDLIKIAKQEGLNIKEFPWIKEMRYQNRYKKTKNMRELTFSFYREYLFKSKMRYDPLFFAVTIEQFEKMNVQNVGVIAAKVNMEKTEYFPSMEEYRVPIKSILAIWKTKF